MSNDQTKQRFYPSKPKNREGFKKAVAWLGGRELIASLKGTIIYAIYGENMDPRSWMKANIYPNVQEKIKYKIEEDKKSQDNIPSSVAEAAANTKVREDKKTREEIQNEVNTEWLRKIDEQWKWKKDHYKVWDNLLKDQTPWKTVDKDGKETVKEFWFDYIADTGDGQLGVYGVGCMCLSDLWMEKVKVGEEVRFEPPESNENGEFTENLELLPRGNFLFVGGDTAYHSATYETLFERFQTPFRWAFMSVRRFTSKHYSLKKTQDEKFFLLNGVQKNVYRTRESTEPIDEWDGTLGKIEEKERYLEAGGIIKEKIKYWDSEPLRPIFGVPANHDYYDSIDGFNKQFRRPPFDEIEENMVYEDAKGRMLLQIPTFAREQEASYIAINLPFDWWMFGIDSENEKLDYRQELFFQQIVKDKPKKLIITTPEPTTVFGKVSDENAKTAKYLKAITEAIGLKQPFLCDGNFEIMPPKRGTPETPDDALNQQMEIETTNKSLNSAISPHDKYCRLDISGDVHHYARYWGENTRKFDGDNFWAENYASLVAGGGGAFFDSTETLIGKTYDSERRRIRKDGTGNAKKEGADVYGEIPPQRVFPNVEDSLNRMSDRIFDLWNIKKGGYVQLAGAVISIIIFFLLTNFSNASEKFKTLDNTIRSNIPFDLPDFSINEPYFPGFILTLVVIALIVGAVRLNNLISELKEKQFEDRIDKKWDGSIYQILWRTVTVYLSLLLYFYFVKYLYSNPKLLSDIHAFTKSYFLLIHFVITGMLIWLSMDYANWLPVRFKLTRNSTEKTYLQKVEDPNETPRYWFEPLLGQLSREFSYRYIPSYILVLTAVANLIFGLSRFGDLNLAKTFSDLLLLTVIMGGLVIISYSLAVKTGAAYHDKTSSKIQFFLIGLFHALLQLFTPFIVYYYVKGWYFLILVLIVFVINGFFISSTRLKTSAFTKNWVSKKSLLYKFTDFQGATYIMKIGNRKLLTVCGLVYGLLFLLVPFLIIKYYPNSLGVKDYAYDLTIWLVNSIGHPEILSWAYLFVSLAIVAYLGYYMSRVWFSCYLSVSLAYNGHNNEAGGAARIEGFKHILRIKVENERLTVYVIGFKDAEHKLESLKLKLVDKFTLKCKPVL